MRYVKHFFCVLIVISGIVFSACSAESGSELGTSLAITDSLGRHVLLSSPPERIVIAGKANFMINDAVYLFPQAPEKVIALTQAQQGTQQFVSLLEADYDQKARFTLNSSAEEIAAVHPDLVLLKTFMQGTLGEGLEQLEIPVVYLSLETPEQYKNDIAVLGNIFGDSARAEEIWRYYQTILDTTYQAVQNIPENNRQSVLVIQYNSSGGQQAFQIPPEAWIQTQMVTLAGGAPVWLEAAQGNWAVVNFEQIAVWNPEHIFVLSYFEHPDEVITHLKSDPKWQQLTAVQNDRLYGFPKDYYSWDQPDTRWGLGLMWLANHILPSVKPDYDISHEFHRFYDELYKLDPETVNQTIIPLVQGVHIKENIGR